MFRSVYHTGIGEAWHTWDADDYDAAVAHVWELGGFERPRHRPNVDAADLRSP